VRGRHAGDVHADGGGAFVPEALDGRGADAAGRPSDDGDLARKPPAWKICTHFRG
jgi:hypothetical protein